MKQEWPANYDLIKHRNGLLTPDIMNKYQLKLSIVSKAPKMYRATKKVTQPDLTALNMLQVFLRSVFG